MTEKTSIKFRHHTSALQPGMFAALHCHNDFELIYVVSGELAHVVEGRRYLLRPGSLALVRPSTYHYLQVLSDEPYERYNILFDGIPESERLPRDLEVADLSDNRELTALFAKMDLYAQAKAEDFHRLLELLLRELCLSLALFPQGQREKEVAQSPILSRALQYINENLFTLSNVEEVAGALFISSSYLYALFRESLHQTPQKYIRDKRLLAAQRRIRAGGKPTAVCRECGFREYATFYRNYMAFFGHSPSAESID